MSRNTVTRLLELSEPPRYERAGSGSKLDPHNGSIAAMLDVHPKVPATVIIEHLRRDGYDGGITILKVVVCCEGVEIARHRRSYVPADVVLDPVHARQLRLARQAHQRLRDTEPQLQAPDLARYDALVETTR